METLGKLPSKCVEAEHGIYFDEVYLSFSVHRH